MGSFIENVNKLARLSPSIDDIREAYDNAVIATAQADIATTKAREASISASIALASEQQASVYAGMIAISVDTIENMTAISLPQEGQVVVVRDANRGGVFIYRSTGVANGGTIFDSSSTGKWCRQYDGAVNVKWFGAVGDNTTDDSNAFQKAVWFCENTQDTLHIQDSIGYYLEDKIQITKMFSITSDRTFIRWGIPDVDKVGFEFNCSSGSESFGEVRLPILLSPAINRIYAYPGYTDGSWEPSLRVGHAVNIIGGHRNKFFIHDANGFETLCRVECIVDNPFANNDIIVNTSDLCIKGLHIVGTAWTMAQNTFSINTLFAKYPIYIQNDNATIHGWNIDITGGCFVNEVGGAVLYTEDNQGLLKAITSSTIHVNWAHAGYREDSPVGTETNYVAPLVAGNSAYNGSYTAGDFNTTQVGFFGGSYNKIDINTVIKHPNNNAASYYFPAAGRTFRIRDAGISNDISIDNYSKYLYSAGNSAAIPLATVNGEVNYNGGIGGASHTKLTFVSATMSGLPVGGSKNFFMYSQLIVPGTMKPIKVIPINITPINNNLDIVAFDDGNSYDRLIRVVVKNNGTVAYTGTIYLFIGVE